MLPADQRCRNSFRVATKGRCSFPQGFKANPGLEFANAFSVKQSRMSKLQGRNSFRVATSVGLPPQALRLCLLRRLRQDRSFTRPLRWYGLRLLRQSPVEAHVQGYLLRVLAAFQLRS